MDGERLLSNPTAERFYSLFRPLLPPQIRAHYRDYITASSVLWISISLSLGNLLMAQLIPQTTTSTVVPLWEQAILYFSLCVAPVTLGLLHLSRKLQPAMGFFLLSLTLCCIAYVLIENSSLASTTIFINIYAPLCILLVNLRFGFFTLFAATLFNVGIFYLLPAQLPLTASGSWDYTAFIYLGTLSNMTVALFIVVMGHHVVQQETLYRLEKQTEALNEAALTDPLTGLKNRRYVQQTIDITWQSAIRETQPLGLILIDIDYFKQYNDHYGHLAGDLCLQEFADILRRATHRHSDLAIRYGGEEFAILLHSNLRGCRLVAQRIQDALANSNLVHQTSPLNGKLTLSIGVGAMIPSQGGPDFEAFFKQVDAALYRAKHQGRNQIQLVSAKRQGLASVIP